MKALPSEEVLIDVHSHLPEEESGVFRIYNHFLAEAPESPDLEGSIGLHPWHIQPGDEQGLFMEKFNRLAAFPGIIALGEAGLDALIACPMDIQKTVFELQARLGEDLKKPLIIHCVKAFEPLMELRRMMGALQPWIIHGFQGNYQLAMQLREEGCFISLSERLLKNRERAMQLIQQIPRDFIFIETDEGKSPINQLYREVADMSGISVNELKLEIFRNYKKVFS